MDVYEAYQILDNEWSRIAIDLEIIQTEGFGAARQVDPNMVIKRKDNKEIEVQEGWIGHVIPFGLVQSAYFFDELSKLNEYETRLSKIASEYEKLLDGLSEEDKSRAFVNDDKTAFVAAEVKKSIKVRDVEDEIIAVLKKYTDLAKEEKTLKSKSRKTMRL